MQDYRLMQFLLLAERWALALAQPAAWQEAALLPQPLQTLPLLAQQLARLAPA
jgi:hypothetical protein